MDVSIVVPAFNEDRFLPELLRRLTACLSRETFDWELIIVDDGSTDGTRAILEQCAGVTVIHHKTNRGRAAAVKSGVAASAGRFVTVFDADLEYFPEDLMTIVRVGLSFAEPRVVYGSRYLRVANRRSARWGALLPLVNQNVGPWIANWVLALEVGILYGQWYTEHLSGIRLYPGDFVRDADTVSSGFEGDHELAGKAIRAGYDVVEVPIAYAPRTVAEGKKIRAVDGLIAMKVLAETRFASNQKPR